MQSMLLSFPAYVQPLETLGVCECCLPLNSTVLCVLWYLLQQDKYDHSPLATVTPHRKEQSTSKPHKPDACILPLEVAFLGFSAPICRQDRTHSADIQCNIDCAMYTVVRYANYIHRDGGG